MDVRWTSPHKRAISARNLGRYRLQEINLGLGYRSRSDYELRLMLNL